MKILKKGGNFSEKFFIMSCARCLREEESVCLFPVEPNYILACNWNDKIARNRFGRLKRGHSPKAVQMFAADIEMLFKNGYKLGKKTAALVEALCPASLTIIEKSDLVGELPFMIPNNEFAMGVVEGLNSPVAATSLGKKVPSFEAAQRLLRVEKPDVAVDLGELEQNIKPSTVVEIEGDKYKILREGAVAAAAIKEVME